MRIVVACVPQTGHVLPLLPLAQAFAAVGDEVIVASGADAEELVSGRGLQFRAVGPGLGEWFGALRARTRGIPGDGLKPSRILTYFVPRLFGEVGMSLMIDDLLELCRQVEPAVLVFDPYVFAAPLVAAATGAHAVLHSIGPLMDRDVLGLVADAVSPIWREFAMEVPSAAGVYSGTTLAICPPSLDSVPEDLSDVRPMRPAPLPVAEPALLPVCFAEPSNPLVYVTLGTFSNNDLAMFGLVLEALADEPVNVLATIGKDNDPSVLAPVPTNARVEQFIPQAQVLPHCAAVVHHAGAGTMFGVLAHGLASMALPQSADNFILADLLLNAGAAVKLMPEEVSPAAVRSGVRSVLDTPSYAQRARQLASEIAAMPSANEVAATLRARAGA